MSARGCFVLKKKKKTKYLRIKFVLFKAPVMWVKQIQVLHL